MATRLIITGRVQGVGYREWMCREARHMGLTGWVRNLRDGSVEAVVDGAPEAVSRIIERARKGPPAARVGTVKSEEVAGVFSGFECRASA